MEDPVLNRSLEESKELQTRWSQFHDFFNMAAKQGAKVTPQAEMKFLELKSRIAMLHDSFMSGLKHEQKTGQNIMAITSDIIMLKRVTNSSEAERQKFEFDWNECFLLLTEQVGALEEEKKRIGAINERSYRAGQRKDLMVAKLHNFMHSKILKFFATVIVLVVVCWGLPASGLVKHKDLWGIQAIRPAVVFFVNFVYRPILDHDIEYLSPLDNKYNLKYDTELMKDRYYQQLATEKLTVDFFKKNVLGTSTDTDFAESFQMSGNVLTEALGIIDHAMDLKTEHPMFMGQDVFLFYFLLDSTAAAQRLVELMNQAMNSAAKKDGIRQNYYVARRANFLAVGYSKVSGHRRDQIINRWYFSDTEPNQLK